MTIKASSSLSTVLCPRPIFWALGIGSNSALPALNCSPLIAFDPGETTGYVVVRANRLPWTVGQIHGTITYQGLTIKSLLMTVKPGCIVAEDYRVYKTHAKDHINSQVFTARMLGVLEYLAETECSTKLVLRMAGVAKPFFTDEKLETFGLYVEGFRHGRDAIRHACYQMFFGDTNVS